MMAGGDGLHGDESGRKRELRLLKNKLVRILSPFSCVTLFVIHFSEIDFDIFATFYWIL